MARDVVTSSKLSTNGAVAQPAGVAITPANGEDALWRIAVATHTRIGFESVDFVRLRGGLKDVPAFPISSREEALKAAVDIGQMHSPANVFQVGICKCN